MRLKLSLFHDQSVFMGEMADILKAESFITQFSSLFSFRLSLLITPTILYLFSSAISILS